MDLTAPSQKNKTAVFNLDGSATIKTYALNIAQNLMESKRRKTVPIAQNEIKTDPTEGFSPFTTAPAPVDFGLQLFENKNLVTRLLSKLKGEKPEYAKLIELRYWKEMSHQEIADSQLTSANTAGTSKKNTALALKKLVEIAREEGVLLRGTNVKIKK
jgi:DNA-directed RNA polymerase specialized sigma24 family protein